MGAVIRSVTFGRPEADPGLCSAFRAVAGAFRAVAGAGRVHMGASEEALDAALADTLGWLIATGPEPTPAMGADAALRIERFIKRALVAAEANRG